MAREGVKVQDVFGTTARRSVKERLPMPGKRHFRFLGIAILLPLVVILAVALPSVSADGDDGWDQAPPIPEKGDMKYPNLGSRLDQLVARVAEGETSAGEAAEEALVHREGSVTVTINLSGNVDAVVSFLDDNGGDPRDVGEDYVEAYVPVSLLGPLSEQPGVIRVREIIPPEPDQVAQRVAGHGPPVHGSAAWNREGYTGRGVKVGIIDVGFEGFRGLMGTELPATVVARCYTETGVFTRDLTDCAVDGNHGTSVAETVIDIAPKVSLYIANPVSRGDLRQTVAWMVSEGVLVINESLGWPFDGPGDGTSPFSNSPLNTVDRAVDGGAVWVNAVGNLARTTWFGDYVDTDGDDFVSFAEPEVEFVRLDVKEGERVVVQLRWEDDWDGAATDLDLYLYNAGTRLFTHVKSEDEQSGKIGQVPLERFWFTLEGDSNAFGILVNHFSGGIPDWIQLGVWGVAEIEHYTGNGSINNPSESANPGMLAVGAAHWYDVRAIEPYSSRGPTPDGRVKPDIVGADCGVTALIPLDKYNEGFCGTSQAAPHVAGMVALVKQRFPDYTPQQVADYLKDNAAQRESPDPNNTWGHGFAQMPSSQETLKEAERAALVALYNATGGPNWTNNANWVSSQPVGLWHGVTTDPSGRVVGLSLHENELSGEIPTELGNLASLTNLVLRGNGLIGEIPTELGSLANVRVLDLSGNHLTGGIPTELGGLAKLQELRLRDNELSGKIPAELGSLSNLTTLALGENPLTGHIPTELGSLTNLEQLWLNGTGLTGTILAELGSLTSLTVLGLGGNQLTGPIPTELGGLANLESLGLWGNLLTGTIPSQLGSLANLQVLYLSGNQLTGGIPTELGSLSNLKELYLADNQLTGEIPPELGSLTNLTTLVLWGNDLTGDMPSWPDNLSNLEVLSLSKNRLTGEIPPALGSLTSLTILALGENPLTGHIPTELGTLTNLEQLWLNDNGLTGTIPAELGSLANLTVLALDGNQLIGPIPTWLDSLTNLQELYLNDNELTGEIPTELRSLANLAELVLSGNQLTGEIPSQLGSLSNLQLLNLSGSQLTGGIPTELGSLTNLEVLSLSQNQLTGPIPAELGSLANLEGLHLTRNLLTGTIPSQLGNLANLEVLSLWDNRLSGVVPQTLAGLTMLEHFSFYNNLGLCAPIDDAFQTWLRGISILHGSSCVQADSPEDRAVLVKVHSTTDGVNWTNNANWLSGRLTRQWYGVTNDANGRVNGLFLGGNQLTGKIPPELGDLANLELLYLHENQLTGPIPAELGRLTGLQELSLRDNQLTGEIPAELGNLTNLTRLSLRGNQFTGCIPAGLKDVPDNDFAQVGLPFCTSGDPLITRYDADKNGQIDRSEVIKAINDYLFDEGDPITRAEVIKLINLYLFG